jgi:hypothetical protein
LYRYAALCCDQPFQVKRVNKDGSVSYDVGRGVVPYSP